MMDADGNPIIYTVRGRTDPGVIQRAHEEQVRLAAEFDEMMDELERNRSDDDVLAISEEKLQDIVSKRSDRLQDLVPDGFFTIDEMARAYEMTPAAVRQWIRDGSIHADRVIKVGAREVPLLSARSVRSMNGAPRWRRSSQRRELDESDN